MPRDCGRKKETEKTTEFNYGCQNDLGPVGISTGAEQLQKCVIRTKSRWLALDSQTCLS